ncbi:MAG: CapA family protein [Balneolaceae bacterium]|nr:CapA family protein [Balneolaceae bacterium]
MEKKTRTSSKDLKLFLAGDVMTGRGIDQILPHSVDPILFESCKKNAKEYVHMAEEHSGPIPSVAAYDYVWGYGLPELEKKNPDVRIINFETAVTTYGNFWPNKHFHFRMHPKNAELLIKAGINVCVLGNNHTMDWDIDGLRETLRVLEGNKIAVCGAGLNSEEASTPVKLNTGKGRLLIFSYTTSSAGTPASWEAKQDLPGVNFLHELGKSGARKVMDDVESHGEENDRIVISIHWGRNWGYLAPKNHRKFAHYLIDKGAADVIYGHSSHHPNRIEVYKNRLILYGCGDLINDYEGTTKQEQFRGELSLMYFPTLEPSGKLKSLEMLPLKIHRFQLTKPTQDEIEWLAENLTQIGDRFGTSVEKTDTGELFLKWGRKKIKYRLKDMF